MQCKRWLHGTRGTFHNTGHLRTDLYIEKSDTDSASTIFSNLSLNESYLYFPDFYVDLKTTCTGDKSLSEQVTFLQKFAIGWLPLEVFPVLHVIDTITGGTHTHLISSALATHACESNYRLSFLVKKIQISIIENRWWGSMCVSGEVGGGDWGHITGHLYLNEACVTRWSGHSMEPAGGW